LSDFPRRRRPGLWIGIVEEPQALLRAPELADATDILVTNHWRSEYPPVPQVRLVQSVATGIELIDAAAVPHGAAICNAFGHETAIAEYVLMTMLVWSHLFREIEGEFRAQSSWRPSWVQSGAPHGEIFGSTVGIIGLGRVGREVAPCRGIRLPLIAANRSARRAESGVERVYPLTELDQMLPACDFVVLCTALGPETERLIDSCHLRLMKRSAFLINIARGAVVDEDAIYAALRDGGIGGAALDVGILEPGDQRQGRAFEPLAQRVAPRRLTHREPGDAARPQAVLHRRADNFALLPKRRNLHRHAGLRHHRVIAALGDERDACSHLLRVLQDLALGSAYISFVSSDRQAAKA
jgi:phosphoglycerate dehydrogenase-like enzyme